MATPEDITTAELEASFVPDFNTDLYDILEKLRNLDQTVDEAYHDILLTVHQYLVKE